MFNPIEASKSIKDEFISYVSTNFHIADRDYAKQFTEDLNKVNTVAKGPYLDISDSFETGENIETLISEGELSPLFQDLENGVSESNKEIKLKRKLYLHQEMAIRKINQEHNLVVTTGTGSGKTECFILPIINHLLREKEQDTLTSGVRAILIYPMNALANDQMKRLRQILKNYPSIRLVFITAAPRRKMMLELLNMDVFLKMLMDMLLSLYLMKLFQEKTCGRLRRIFW